MEIPVTSLQEAGTQGFSLQQAIEAYHYEKASPKESYKHVHSPTKPGLY